MLEKRLMKINFYLVSIASISLFLNSCEKEENTVLPPEKISVEKEADVGESLLYDLEIVKEKLEVGMSREEVVELIGEPNKSNEFSMTYFKWDPRLIVNINKKGVFGVVVSFEDSKVVHWGEEAQFY